MEHDERRMPGLRQRVILLGAISVSVLVVGCSSGWQVRNVTDVGNGISLDISSCSATYDVSVEETADRVDVTINQEDAGEPSADCADEVVVDLEAPLADRSVIVNDEHPDVRDPEESAAWKAQIAWATTTEKKNGGYLTPAPTQTSQPSWQPSGWSPVDECGGGWTEWATREVPQK